MNWQQTSSPILYKRTQFMASQMMILKHTWIYAEWLREDVPPTLVSWWRGPNRVGEAELDEEQGRLGHVRGERVWHPVEVTIVGCYPLWRELSLQSPLTPWSSAKKLDLCLWRGAQSFLSGFTVACSTANFGAAVH